MMLQGGGLNPGNNYFTDKILKMNAIWMERSRLILTIKMSGFMEFFATYRLLISWAFIGLFLRKLIKPKHLLIPGNLSEPLNFRLSLFS